MDLHARSWLCRLMPILTTSDRNRVSECSNAGIGSIPQDRPGREVGVSVELSLESNCGHRVHQIDLDLERAHTRLYARRIADQLIIHGRVTDREIGAGRDRSSEIRT